MTARVGPAALAALIGRRECGSSLRVSALGAANATIWSGRFSERDARRGVDALLTNVALRKDLVGALLGARSSSRLLTTNVALRT